MIFLVSGLQVLALKSFNSNTVAHRKGLIKNGKNFEEEFEGRVSSISVDWFFCGPH